MHNGGVISPFAAIKTILLGWLAKLSGNRPIGGDGPVTPPARAVPATSGSRQDASTARVTAVHRAIGDPELPLAPPPGGGERSEYIIILC